MYNVLVEGDTWAFINHIKVHKSIVSNCQVKKEVVAARSLILAKGRKIVTLTVANWAANKVEIDNLVEINRELAETVRTS